MIENYDPDTFKPGEMDVSGHHETFAGFVKTCVITTVIVIFVLIFLLIVGV